MASTTSVIWHVVFFPFTHFSFLCSCWTPCYGCAKLVVTLRQWEEVFYQCRKGMVNAPYCYKFSLLFAYIQQIQVEHLMVSVVTLIVMVDWLCCNVKTQMLLGGNGNVLSMKRLVITHWASPLTDWNSLLAGHLLFQWFHW